VKEAQSGDVLRAGVALVCPGNRHLKIKRLFREEIAVLSDEPHVNGHRPSVDVLFRSVARECGPRGICDSDDWNGRRRCARHGRS
jgi:two-component system chemotaxis response regulator CheB